MGRPSKYSPEFREEAVALVASSGRTVAEVARDLGVNDTTLGNWVKADRAERAARRGERDASGQVPLSGEERAELGRLRRENAKLQPGQVPWTHPVVGVVRGQLRRPGLYVLQTPVALLLITAALVAVSVLPGLGRYLVATDKEELLFAGDAEWRAGVAAALAARPSDEPAFAALRAVSLAVAPELEGRREEVRRRVEVIAAAPALAARERGKHAAWEALLAQGLVARGVPPTHARLLGRIAVACFEEALTRWATPEHPDRSMAEELAAAFAELAAAIDVDGQRPARVSLGGAGRKRAERRGTSSTTAGDVASGPSSPREPGGGSRRPTSPPPSGGGPAP